MPLPEPIEGEDKTQFITRCLADDTMADEYPNILQRYAVCQAQWINKIENKEKSDQ